MEKQIYRTKSTDRTLSYTANKVASLRIKDSVKTTVRVYGDGYIGVAGKSGEADLSKLEQSAVAALGNKAAYPAPEDKGNKLIIDTGKEIIKKSELVKKGEELIKKISEDNQDFIFSGKTVVKDVEDDYTCGNTSYVCKSSYQLTYFILKHKMSASIMDEVYGVFGTEFDDKKIASDVNKLADAYLNLLPSPEEDEVTVISESSVAAHLFKSFLAQAYCGGASLLSGKLGKKAFSENFSWYCEQDPRKASGVVFFDGEGVVNENFRSYFVKNGVMCNLFTTRQTAEKYGVENAGTATAPFAAMPEEGTEGFVAEPTAENVADILKGEKAVYLSTVSGGDMTSSGDLALPVQTSYLYKDGKLTGRFPQFTVAANILDILGKDYLGASNNGIWSTGENNYIVFRAKIVNKS